MLNSPAVAADHAHMTPTAPAPAPDEREPTAQRRRAKTAITARSGLFLLAGLLLVAGIPVFATVRILDRYALVNERDRADSALRVQLQGAGEALDRLSDDASDRAADLSGSPVVQRAFLTGDRAELVRLARKEPGVVFYLRGRRVAGPQPPVSLTRSVSLTLDGIQVGSVMATVALDGRLGVRLLQEVPHVRGDRLLIVRRNVVVGTSRRVAIDGRTARLAGQRYRALRTRVPNTTDVSMLALRSEAEIDASIQPYRQRVQYAAIGSFALLVLVGLLFGRPILRSLGDFRRLASQAATDALTGLANRRSFDEELVLEWRRAERIGALLGLILIDIDDFKSVNDEFGHRAGDEALRTFGEVLRSHVRQVDLAARYGGEEFAVIVPETDLEGTLKLAERLRTGLMNTPIGLPDGAEFRLTASFGAAVKDGLTRAEELVAAADEALYQAKRDGKNRVAPEVLLMTVIEPAVAPVERRRRPPAKKAAAKSATESPTKAIRKKPAKAATTKAAKPVSKKPAQASRTRRKAAGEPRLVNRSNQSSSDSRPTVKPGGRLGSRSKASRTPGT